VHQKSNKGKLMEENIKIRWIPPEPRSGMKGALDKFFGPTQTASEFWLGIIPSVIAAIAVPAYAIHKELGWSLWQLLIGTFFAFDLTGGVIFNATSSAKLWYHRSGQGFKQLFGSTSAHIHPLLIAWLWLDGDWGYFVITYGFLLFAAILILRVPLYLQRPFALTLYLAGLIIGLYFLAPIKGLEWFLPFFYLKLLISHLLKEAPFQPLYS